MFSGEDKSFPSVITNVITLGKLIEIKSHPDMTLKQACNAIMTWIKENDMLQIDTGVITENEKYSEESNKIANPHFD